MGKAGVFILLYTAVVFTVKNLSRTEYQIKKAIYKFNRDSRAEYKKSKGPPFESKIIKLN